MTPPLRSFAKIAPPDPGGDDRTEWLKSELAELRDATARLADIKPTAPDSVRARFRTIVYRTTRSLIRFASLAPAGAADEAKAALGTLELEYATLRLQAAATTLTAAGATITPEHVRAGAQADATAKAAKLIAELELGQGTPRAPR